MQKILVVDDSGFHRSSMKRYLKEYGYTVDTAKDGIEGLEKIKIINPDCVFLDILMPRMTGIEVLEKMNEAKIAVPIIVLSADMQSATQAICMRLGAKSVLQKPADKETLHKEIQKIIKR